MRTRDERVLLRKLRLKSGHLGLGGLHVGSRLRKRCTVVSVINTREYLTGFYGLVILHLYGRDVTRNPGGDHRGVGLGIRIVCRNDEAGVSLVVDGARDPERR